LYAEVNPWKSIRARVLALAASHGYEDRRDGLPQFRVRLRLRPGIKDNQLTIGLDLGDRTSHYCILNEAGEVIWEQELPTTAKGSEQVFRKIPRSRIALETGTHSPWISRR
jgi:transposase